MVDGCALSAGKNPKTSGEFNKDNCHVNVRLPHIAPAGLAQKPANAGFAG